MKERDSIWTTIDWVSIALYLILLALGWLSICGASYNFGEMDFFSFDSRAGKQLVWIFCSFGLACWVMLLTSLSRSLKSSRGNACSLIPVTI